MPEVRRGKQKVVSTSMLNESACQDVNEKCISKHRQSDLNDSRQHLLLQLACNTSPVCLAKSLYPTHHTSCGIKLKMVLLDTRDCCVTASCSSKVMSLRHTEQKRVFQLTHGILCVERTLDVLYTIPQSKQTQFCYTKFDRRYQTAVKQMNLDRS